MVNITTSILAIAMSAIFGLRPLAGAAPVTFIDERNIRTVSAGQYSELLRLACANGWKFRPSDVVAGFTRHFEETQAALLDRGARVVPLGHVPELEVVEMVFARAAPSRHPDRRGCFRARWRMPVQERPEYVRRAPNGSAGGTSVRDRDVRPGPDEAATAVVAR